MMIIKAKCFDEKGTIIFNSNTEVNPFALIEAAKSRKEMVHSKGKAWACGAVPELGKNLVEIAIAGRLGDEVEKSAIEVAMAAWLYESIFCGLDFNSFTSCNLIFTIFSDGAVKYDRISASS